MSYTIYRSPDDEAPRSQLLEDFILLGQALGSAFTVLTRNSFDAPLTGYRGRPL